MQHFDNLFDIAAARHGGPDALNAKLQPPSPAADLVALPEERWLSIMVKCIFQAGFNWKVIENKWDGFETAFDGFDIGRCAMMDDEKFDALLQDQMEPAAMTALDGSGTSSIRKRCVLSKSRAGFRPRASDWHSPDLAPASGGRC